MLTALVLSLVLTLLIEGAVGLLWGLRGRDLLLCLLVNVLTNPAVVLLHHLFPAGTVTLALEGAAVWVEGTYYRKYARSVRHPCLLSLCANGLSYSAGFLIGRFLL